MFSAGAVSWKFDSVKWVTNSTPTGYVVIVPTSGSVVVVPQTRKIILNASGALATLTLRLPVVLDKTEMRISTRNRIDALTIDTLQGAAVDWLVGEFPQNGVIALTFVSSLNRWVWA